MKRTKKLSQSEYSSELKPVSFVDHIQALVNREAEVIYKREPVKLPAYKKSEIPKLNAGVFNLVKQMLP